MVAQLWVGTGHLPFASQTLAPENGWIFIARFIVGLGVGGLAGVDLPLLQEFVPASKRGWVSGLSIGLLPLGPLLAALLSASLGAVMGWRGLFAIGLVPAAFAFVIRLWGSSPRAVQAIRLKSPCAIASHASDEQGAPMGSPRSIHVKTSGWLAMSRPTLDSRQSAVG